MNIVNRLEGRFFLCQNSAVGSQPVPYQGEVRFRGHQVSDGQGTIYFLDPAFAFRNIFTLAKFIEVDPVVPGSLKGPRPPEIPNKFNAPHLRPIFRSLQIP